MLSSVILDFLNDVLSIPWYVSVGLLGIADPAWAGGSQHGQGLFGVGLCPESPHELSLALQETEVPREGGIEHIVRPCKASTSLSPTDHGRSGRRCQPGSQEQGLCLPQWPQEACSSGVTGRAGAVDGLCCHLGSLHVTTSFFRLHPAAPMVPRTSACTGLTPHPPSPAPGTQHVAICSEPGPSTDLGNVSW